MEKRITEAMIHLDQKLIFIPLVFILLRMWGNLRFFISFAPSCHAPCGDVLIVRNPCKSVLYNPFLMVMQAICDPGQGWGNALIFVVFHKTLLKRLCPCIFFLGAKLKEHYLVTSKNRRSCSPSVNTKDALLPEEEEENGHHTPIVSDDGEKYKRQRPSYSVTSTQI